MGYGGGPACCATGSGCHECGILYPVVRVLPKMLVETGYLSAETGFTGININLQGINREGGGKAGYFGIKTKS
jgi:hypothetical protein